MGKDEYFCEFLEYRRRPWSKYFRITENINFYATIEVFRSSFAKDSDLNGIWLRIVGFSGSRRFEASWHFTSSSVSGLEMISGSLPFDMKVSQSFERRETHTQRHGFTYQNTWIDTDFTTSYTIRHNTVNVFCHSTDKNCSISTMDTTPKP